MNSAKIMAEQRAMYWTGIIRECRGSGLSVAAYCKEAGIHTSRYYYWLKKLRDEACELLVLSRAGVETAAAESAAPQGFAQALILDDTEGTCLQPLVPINGRDAKGTESPSPNPAKPGQISIEASGIKISADGVYPVSALAELLRGLSND